MKTKTRTPWFLAALWLTLPGAALAQMAAGTEAASSVATGLGVNVSLVGRLVGGGNTLYISTVDVTNNSTTDTQVDFYVDGQDLSSGAAISKVGSISSTGALVAQGAGGSMRHRSNAHFADFIDALVQAGILPASAETDGFIGSVLFVFNGFSKAGQGSATVRFYNSFGGGSIGQSLKGHTVAAGEPQTVVAAFRDSRSQAAEPQLYANLFINNTGLTPAGTGTSGSVTVRLQAFANSTGSATGTTKDLVIGAGHTASVSDVLHVLNVPAGEDTVIVTAAVTSGDAAIAGAAVEIDQTTKDGSVVDMNRGDF